jgi:hypothetical protein
MSFPSLPSFAGDASIPAAAVPLLRSFIRPSLLLLEEGEAASWREGAGADSCGKARLLVRDRYSLQPTHQSQSSKLIICHLSNGKRLRLLSRLSKVSACRAATQPYHAYTTAQHTHRDVGSHCRQHTGPELCLCKHMRLHMHIKHSHP